MAPDSAVQPTETMQERVALVSESEAAVASGPRNPDRLSILPQEILLEIFSVLPAFRDKGCFVLTSRYLHQIFDKYLYESAGATLSWLPVFLAARQGNIANLEKCEEFNAPANISWNRKHSSKACVDPEIRHGASPLDEAIMNLQVRVVEWFLARGTSPNRQKGICSPLIRAFWMLRKNTIASLPATQRRTHRNRYSAFAMEKLRGRAEKARAIVDLLRGAGADLSRSEANFFDSGLAWINPNTGTRPSRAPWVRLFDPNSVAMSDWLGIAQVLGFSR
ncbi:Hypothetical protein NCS54_01105900 [Fusarium falciforme]|uniref:Hypothetical protein n=1 Tax=Fusarium falciforme TaxID=195108 RepID=UPI00230073A5|nr:Hypothetical protein NCS54_01105900 [Fusarium falciforme]WAO93509.1 Hypothetical protein NCS54_01105900 [Fusarium falciforme]